jgi:hypothetical protein
VNKLLYKKEEEMKNKISDEEILEIFLKTITIIEKHKRKLECLTQR